MAAIQGMSVFQFRKFAVSNERSAMKVNTDGVLLGALMTLRPGDRSLLDAGTGTGAIALMAAQRVEGADFKITAIDIDADSAAEAQDNFAASPWSGRLRAECVSLQDFDAVAGEFDVIFSNPPYFESSLRSPDPRRMAARHTDTMSYRSLIEFAAEHLTAEGRLAIIIPSEAEKEARLCAASFGLALVRVVRVRSTAKRAPMRAVMEFARSRAGDLMEEELTIQDGAGYTEGYRALMKDFLLLGSEG